MLFLVSQTRKRRFGRTAKQVRIFADRSNLSLTRPANNLAIQLPCLRVLCANPRSSVTIRRKCFITIDPRTTPVLRLTDIALPIDHPPAALEAAILKRLRSFIEKGEADMRIESAALIVGEATALLSSAMKKRGIELRVENRVGELAVLADRVQIQQVALNLIRNAIDALKGTGVAAPEIRVAVRLLHGPARVEVRVVATDRESTPR